MLWGLICFVHPSQPLEEENNFEVWGGAGMELSRVWIICPSTVSHSMVWCIHNGAYIWATSIGRHFNAQEIRLSIFMFGGSRSGYARKRWISSWPSSVPENRVDGRNPPVSSDLYFWFSVYFSFFMTAFKFHTTPQNEDVGEVCFWFASHAMNQLRWLKHRRHLIFKPSISTGSAPLP